MLGPFCLGLGLLDSEPWHTFQQEVFSCGPPYWPGYITHNICHGECVFNKLPEQQQKAVKRIT